MPLKNGKTTAALQTIVVGSVIPAGTIAPFGGDTVPAGWLLCNGSTVSRATYANLFSAVGTVHGQGDGSTTFHLPDYRGRFLRGVDGAAGRDPDTASRTAANTGGNAGDAVGSIQGHAFQTHTHVQNAHAHNMTSNATNGNAGTTSPYSSTAAASYTNTDDIQTTTATNQNASASGTHAQATANETRPVNANVNYIIKV